MKPVNLELAIALVKCDATEAERIIHEQSIDVSEMLDNGYFYLEYLFAIDTDSLQAFKHNDCLKLLLKHGADINQGYVKYEHENPSYRITGDTYIHNHHLIKIAIDESNLDLLQYLMTNYRSHFDKPIFMKSTPLRYCIEMGQTDAFRTLLEMGVDWESGEVFKDGLDLVDYLKRKHWRWDEIAVLIDYDFSVLETVKRAGQQFIKKGQFSGKLLKKMQESTRGSAKLAEWQSKLDHLSLSQNSLVTDVIPSRRGGF